MAHSTMVRMIALEMRRAESGLDEKAMTIRIPKVSYPARLCTFRDVSFETKICVKQRRSIVGTHWIELRVAHSGCSELLRAVTLSGLCLQFLTVKCVMFRTRGIANDEDVFRVLA